MNREKIEEILSGVIDPYIKKDIISTKSVKNVSVKDNKVSIEIEFGYPLDGIKEKLSKKIKDEITQACNIDCIINISSKIFSHAAQKGTQILPNVKNTIAVASGKGGVGKSTTSINLALALHAEGASVGILDADIYGPSQPRMLGLKGKPDSHDGKTVEPKENYHIQSMSIGYLIDEETPMIWRGPMVTGALEQLLNDTNWRDLDYLVIDLPPGTGDIQLTLCQKIPVSGAVIVTTPQDIALLDARKALKMFEKVQVPVLGIIENMSTHICSKCGNEEHIFGSGGGESMAKQYEVELLGSLPLDVKIREGVDNGKPTVAIEPNSVISDNYRDIARSVAAKISLQAKDYTSRFPKIVIENN
ncbi:MAG: iron-sulfur cluster carrier protein ApbC [Legionellales bacterium]|jgi:ATP-binding protein involved in chromosome partitioning|nr:iron-sulfur cluster carrier protein ApbC [Legionellales bacterium]|tara:strand:- start:1069 stop:2148 length:1080 start_codon:yes stop_codon:yes gene_type:complete